MQTFREFLLSHFGFDFRKLFEQEVGTFLETSAPQSADLVPIIQNGSAKRTSVGALGAGGSITNEAPVNTIPVTVDEDGNLGAQSNIPLVDPGNVWEPNTAVTEGYRIAETVQGELRVFEAASAGTTGDLSGFADLTIDLTPLGLTTDGDDPFFDWRYLGIVGQLSWALAPTQPELQVVKDSDRRFVRIVHRTAPPADSRQLLQVMATVEGEPVSIFEMKTDGDGDYLLDENTGAGLRISNSIDGAVAGGKHVEITANGVRVANATGQSFSIQYEPFAVVIVGLPTTDPEFEDQLWKDAGTLKISAG